MINRYDYITNRILVFIMPILKDKLERADLIKTAQLLLKRNLSNYFRKIGTQQSISELAEEIWQKYSNDTQVQTDLKILFSYCFANPDPILYKALLPLRGV